MQIGIYLYDEAEVLDFSGPFEVLSTASHISGDALPPFQPCLIAETKAPLNARGGFSVNPNHSIHEHPPLDVLIVVGGVHDAQLHKPQVLEWIAEQAKSVDIVASICTGAFLLAEAGVLSDQRVTTHWQDIPDLRERYPNLSVVENARWVQAGNIVTSGGISAGIDMALYLVSELHSEDLAVRTALQMEFDWTKNR